MIATWIVGGVLALIGLGVLAKLQNVANEVRVVQGQLAVINDPRKHTHARNELQDVQRTLQGIESHLSILTRKPRAEMAQAEMDRAEERVRRERRAAKKRDDAES